VFAYRIVTLVIGLPPTLLARSLIERLNAEERDRRLSACSLEFERAAAH
jgi:hypothetical protein